MKDSEKFEIILDFVNKLPGDIHWGNHTTFHKTELENERYDQGFNEYHRRMKAVLMDFRKKYKHIN